MYLSHRQTSREITKKIAYTFQQAENLSKRVVQARETKRRHGGAMQLQRRQTRTGTYNTHTYKDTHTEISGMEGGMSKHFLKC